MLNGADRLKTALRFLIDLFDGAPEGAQILIWTIDADGRKASHWFETADAAAEFVVAPACDRKRVYVGVGWRRENLGEFERGDEKAIGGLVGLWADIDVAGPGHVSPKKYPSTFDEAHALLEALPLAPSIVVNTGGGLHAWWLFKEPFEITNDDDRAEAKRCAREWGETILQTAAARGVAVDSVFDLPRVLRIPGTYRNKEAGSQVLIERSSDNTSAGVRYNFSDFEPYLTRGAAAAQTEAIQVGQLTLRLDAEPPPDKFMALAMNEPRFADTFNGNRKDFRDPSQSSYDLALATFASQASWTDQEIANLLISARRRSGQKIEKCTRLDYIVSRIRLGRQSVASTEVDDELERIATERKARERREALERERVVEELVVESQAGTDRTQILEKLSRVFGTEISGVVQYGREEARYSLKTPTEEIAIGKVEVLREQKRLSNRLYEATHHNMPNYKPAQWRDVTNSILRILEMVEDDEATRVGELREWLRAYVTATHRWVGEKWLGALVNSDPFFRDGNLFVHAPTFTVFLKTKLFEQVNKRDVLDRLRSVGFYSDDVTGRPVVQGKSQHRTRSYWRAPIEFLGEAYRGLIADSVVLVSEESPTQNPDTKSPK
jgi:hypothetical protein